MMHFFPEIMARNPIINEKTKKTDKPNNFKKNSENNTECIANQLSFVNRIFLRDVGCVKDNNGVINHNGEIDNIGEIIKTLKKKISGYRQQDLEKNLPIDLLINFEELIEKLVVSRLRCEYCRRDVLILYNIVRYESQWTLDRINNDLGHSCDNTLVACLKCNLQRRRQIMEAFKFTKQLKIKKIE